MKAKEKAKELHRKFYLFNGESDSWDIAKQCALIVVDEIIKANPHSNPFNTEVCSTMEYWQQVKQEIENL